MVKLIGRSAIVAAALCAVAPAQAASFMFTGAGLSGGYGNSLTLPPSGGITVTATAWSVGDSGTPTTAYLGRYDNGLGVTNRVEVSGENNKHTIDNLGSYDFVRLVFSTAVNLTGINRFAYDHDVNGSTPKDWDAWVSYGVGSNTAIDGTTWGGFLTRGVPVSNSGNYSSGIFSNVWLVGASRIASERNDAFKLTSVSAVVPQVPEPSTWLTMILGFGLMGAALRRRAESAALAAA